ncbi:MAG: response regulator transcription factor [Chthonomonadaceae bacterium]|nr:response regulator transcription factor [Chthonomonadaceae bacterium]
MDGENVALVLLGESENEARLLIGSDLPGIAYLKKEAEQEEIVAAVRSAAAGLVTLDRSFLASLRETISGNLGDAENRFALRYKDPLPPGETLTQREEQVLQLMAQGLPNKQIAAKLTISQHTVKFHVASILAKLNAVSRTEAVTIGARRGLILL